MEFLYHATFLSNLDSIAVDGLVPSASTKFGGGYSGHAVGRIFLTEWDGLGFWMAKMEDMANYSTDWNDEESFGYMPVAIRVPYFPDDEEDDGITEHLQEDILGTRDAGGSIAVFTTEPIPPELLEVWDGKRWVPVDEADSERFLRQIEKQSNFVREEPDEDEDGEPEDERGYWEVDLNMFIPPETAHPNGAVSFREDIPNARWVAEKWEEAELGGRNRWGVPRRMGPITGSFTQPLRLPTELLKPLRGERGEQDAPRPESLRYIADHWERLKDEAVFIEVDPFGEPWVSEGNHRIMVASALGEPNVLAEVRYFGGGQLKAKPRWKPKQLLEFDANADAREES